MTKPGQASSRRTDPKTEKILANHQRLKDVLAAVKTEVDHDALVGVDPYRLLAEGAAIARHLGAPAPQRLGTDRVGGEDGDPGAEVEQRDGELTVQLGCEVDPMASVERNQHLTIGVLESLVVDLTVVDTHHVAIDERLGGDLTGDAE